MRLSGPVALIAAAIAAPLSAAEDQTPILRCLVATASLAQSSDQGAAQVGIMNSLYWMGRIDPAIPESDVQRRMIEIARTYTQADLRADLQRCGAELTARGDMMQRIGKAMAEEGARKEQR